MTTLTKYQNKKIAVYGMGITGISAAKIFKKLKAEVFCWDDNKNTRKKIKKLNFNLSKFWKNQYLVDKIVLSPGIDINKCKIKKYLKKNLNKIITDLDVFFEINRNSSIISITGTNGKSTTCKIIEKILKTAGYNAKTVGNIGNPVLYKLHEKKNFIYILEASSYQLEYSKLFRSKHAAILNISPDHLERHKNIKNYIKIKSRIFFKQNNSDYSYINFENNFSKIIKNIFKNQKLKSKLISVKTSDCKSLKNKISNKFFNSRNNFANLAFAYNIVKKFKIKNEIIIDALNKFKGLPHRQEVVFSSKKFVCINDSKATSFDACLQSLLNHDGIYWIVGGLPKYKDQFDIKRISQKIIKAYVIGRNTSFFVKKIGKKINYTVSKNLKNAVNDIYKDIELNSNLKKKTILFSPAAASFDQFRNFENRGEYFKNLIIRKFKKKLHV